jgi:hypothetical protein
MKAEGTVGAPTCLLCMCRRNNYCLCRCNMQYIFLLCMCRSNNYCLCRHNTQYIKKVLACAEEITTACADIICILFFLNPVCAVEITTACADITQYILFFKSCMCRRNNYCLCRCNMQYIFLLCICRRNNQKCYGIFREQS